MKTPAIRLDNDDLSLYEDASYQAGQWCSPYMKTPAIRLDNDDLSLYEDASY